MRFSTRIWALLIGSIASLTVIGTAAATVTWDAHGTGFVGKGDVQSAFGWNNAQFRANSAGITFTYANDLIEVQRCWQVQNWEPQAPWVRYRLFDEDNVETFEVQRHSQKITGFTLTGPDLSTFSYGFDPWQGDELPSNCFDSTGSLVGSTIDENGNGWLTEDIVDPENTISLFVNFGGDRVRLATVSGGE
jgi:hypothetical protein